MLSLKAGGGFEVSFSPRRLVEFKNQNDTEARCAGKQGDDCLSPVSPLCTASMAELFRITGYWMFMDLDRITNGRGLFSDLSN